jgi:NADP-dependent 3-hydroxy acid dehydrogenase YdfG
MITGNRAVYLVVGGSGGIGADVARQLAAKGARVIVTGRDTGRLAAIGSETGATTLELEARDNAASAICWLLDGAQTWITGKVIGVGGGLGSVQARA